jgi:hypothetical protein
MKESFPDQMLTERGREICRERLERNRRLVARLHAELEDGETSRRFGLLGVTAYLFTNPEDPSVREHARGLRDDWLPARAREAATLTGTEGSAALEALGRSRNFIDLLELELAGES